MTTPPATARPGPSRVTLLQATAQMTDLGWRQTIRSKMLIGIALLVVFSTGIAAIIHNVPENPRPAADFQAIEMLILSTVVVPLIALLLGTNAMAAEREAGTLAYLFTRPIRRAAVVLGKGLAAVAVANIATLLCVVGVWIASGAPDAGVGGGTVALLLETTALTGVFVLLGTITARSLYAGLAYVAFFEGLLSNVVARNSGYTVTYHARNLLTEWSGSAIGAIGGDEFAALPGSAAGSVVTLLGVTVATLALACAWVETREYGLKDRPKEE